MARAFLLSPRLSDAASLTASSAVGGAGVSNLQLARPKMYWRSTSNTPYVQGVFGALIPVSDTLVLGYTNGTQALGTVRLRMASTAAKLTDGTAEFDSSAFAAIPTGATYAGVYSTAHRAYQFTNSAQLGHFRIDFDYSLTESLVYAQLGRLMIGKRIAPVCSVKPGWAPSISEPVAETVDFGGEESPRVMGAKRSIEVTWHNLTQAEAQQIHDLLLERGSAKDVALCVDYDASAFTMMQLYVGRVKSVVKLPQWSKSGTATDGSDARLGISLQINEMAPLDMI